jgi:hypothetical protein
MRERVILSTLSPSVRAIDGRARPCVKRLADAIASAGPYLLALAVLGFDNALITELSRFGEIFYGKKIVDGPMGAVRAEVPSTSRGELSVLNFRTDEAAFSGEPKTLFNVGCRDGIKAPRLIEKHFCVVNSAETIDHISVPLIFRNVADDGIL